MKFENLKSTKKFLDIDKSLVATKVDKKNIIDYLEKRSDERFLILKSYEKEKEELANGEIKELRKKVDFMISNIRKGNKELKRRSLEERFLNQKNIILSNIDKNLEEYKENIEYLNKKIEELNINEVYMCYPFVKDGMEEKLVFAFPIIVEKENGNIYIRNNLKKDILSNKKIVTKRVDGIREALRNVMIENNVIEKIELLDVEIKELCEVEILLEEKNLNQRMKDIINHKKYRTENRLLKNIPLQVSSKDIKQIVTQKDDFLLIGDEYREQLLEVIKNLLISGEKILVIGDNAVDLEENIKNKILSFNQRKEDYELNENQFINEIKELEILIKKAIKIDKIMKMSTDIGMDVQRMCSIIEGHDSYNNDEYLRYKKTLNLDNITYEELNDEIEDVTLEDIEKYKTYKAYKNNFIIFNEYPYSHDELINIKNIIKKIEALSEEKYRLNKKYFKKITFKMKNKGERLNLEELREVGKEIAREKNRELLIKDKNTWSIKNIFNATREKEKRKEELELYKEKEVKEIEKVINFYKELDEIYIILEKLDKNIFKEIISILCKDNYSEEISKKIKNIEFSLENKEILNMINSWSNFKIALVDYLYKMPDLKESAKNLIYFKISDYLFKVSKEFEINIMDEFKEYRKDDLANLVNKKKRIFEEYIDKKVLDEGNLKICEIDNINSINLEEEIYDTIILLNCKFNDEKDILPILYRGKRCLSFRDLYNENEYERTFIRL